MIITQAHIDFYRARKVPAAGLQAQLKPRSLALRRLEVRALTTATIDVLINSQVPDVKRTCRTEPHNILMFIRGWRQRGECIMTELKRLAYQPYGTDPARRTAYARRWYQRLVAQAARAVTDETADERRCPLCGGEVYRRHRAGDGYLPECWWWECEPCGEVVRGPE